MKMVHRISRLMVFSFLMVAIAFFILNDIVFEFFQYKIFSDEMSFSFFSHFFVFVFVVSYLTFRVLCLIYDLPGGVHGLASFYGFFLVTIISIFIAFVSDHSFVFFGFFLMMVLAALIIEITVDVFQACTRQ